MSFVDEPSQGRFVAGQRCSYYSALLIIGAAACWIGEARLTRGADEPRTDLYGDPLPCGAAARLGTIRYRNITGVGPHGLTPDGKVLVCAGKDGAVRFVDAYDGRDIDRLAVTGLEARTACVSPDGTRLAAAGLARAEPHEWHVRVFDFATRVELLEFKVAQDPTPPPSRFATPPSTVSFYPCFSADSKRLVGFSRGRFCVYSADRAAPPLHELRVDRHWSYAAEAEILVHVEPGVETICEVWDVARWKSLRRWAIKGYQPDHEVNRVALSEDGKVLGVCWAPPGGWRLSRDGLLPPKHGDFSIDLVDVVTGNRLRTFNSEGHAARGPLLSHDGSLMACYIADYGTKRGICTRIWDTKRGTELECSPLPPIGAAFFSRDGGYLFGGMQGIRAWYLRQAKAIPTIDAPTGAMRGVQFSTDGKLVATSSSDGTVRAWDPSTGREQFRVELQDGGAPSFAFLDGSRRIVTESLESIKF